jgi:hypothetical protein
VCDLQHWTFNSNSGRQTHCTHTHEQQQQQ